MRIYNTADTIGNVQLMQKLNRLKVLDCIRAKGMVARPEIASLTGLSPSSITNIVTYLMEKNLVAEVGLADSREVGRKATLLKFNYDALNILSIEIETSNINIALTNLNGDIIRNKEISIENHMKDFEILNIIKKEASSFFDDNKGYTKTDNKGHSKISAIGIALSGIVEGSENLLISSSLRWKELSLKKFFKDSFHMPVFVQNTSRTKALFEMNKNMNENEIDKNVIFLDLAMGVGVINIYEQKLNEAVVGEFGHTTVKKDGPVCFCGNRGCLEVMCSVESLINQCLELVEQNKCMRLKELADKDNKPIDYDLIIQAFNEGDRDVESVLRECGEYLGLGIANLINIFNPDKIIVNGDKLLRCNFIYEVAIKEAEQRAYERFTKKLKYEKVDIGMKESIKGISLYVTEKLFDLTGPDNFI